MPAAISLSREGRCNGPGGFLDGATAIDVDRYGNICVTGSSYGPTGYGTDYATVKYGHFPPLLEAVGSQKVNEGQHLSFTLEPASMHLAKAEQFISAYIEMPAEYDPNLIDLASIKLNGTVPAVTDPKHDFVSKPKVYITDIDHDKVPEPLVKFDVESVKDYLYAGDNVLTVSGALVGWPTVPDFAGSDSIRITDVRPPLDAGG